MTFQVFDSHCHLQDEAFLPDREMCFERARAQGVAVIIPGYSESTSVDAVDFANRHEAAWALVGVHPHDAREATDETYARLRQLCQESPKVVGIGEIGLDYHYMHSPKNIQREVFLQQLRIAESLGLPVSVHSRDAEDDTLDAIREVGLSRGVLHCFTGTLAFARALLEMGWYISFSGTITFKSAHDLRTVVREVPLNRILVETDAPYLTPVPWRGQRNEPARVIRVAEVVAAQKDRTTKEVFLETTSNTIELFSRIDMTGIY